MPQKRKDYFFPAESILVQRTKQVSVYKMDFPVGYGTMTAYTVMPGITLIFNDFHTSYSFPEEARCPGLVEINHCQAGRFACTMRDGHIVQLGPQDFAVSDMGRPPRACSFPQGLYQGISLVVEPSMAEQSIGQMLGEGTPDLVELFQSLLDIQSFLLLHSEPKIQHIFSELYDTPEEGRIAYYRLKTAELMLFLHDRQKTMRQAGSLYHSKGVSQRIQEMEGRLTEDLRTHISIADLAKTYQIGVSTFKKYFRDLYGESPYAYLKRRRMEEAAFLLSNTKQEIAQIAQSVGYQNASKFSAAFRDIYGLSPTEYRRLHYKDAVK